MDCVITSIGMVCLVGHDVANACAAIRAGIVRPKDIESFLLLDEETQEPVPVRGYPIHGYTEGFNIVGLWIRGALGCLQNLIEYGQLPDRSDTRFWNRTAMIGVTPPVNDARFESDDSFTPDMIKEVYLNRLLEGFGYPLLEENLAVVCTGHAGAIAAIKQAKTMIEQTKVDRAIVVAVDSYLDPMTLDWLIEHDRLKTSEHPAGLTPGEAGACFMVESLDSSERRNPTIGIRIGEPVLGSENNHLFRDEPNQGIALGKVIEEALRSTLVTVPFNGPVISDFNGEQWRAAELGGARDRAHNEVMSDARFLFPSTSLGEVGAAAAACGI